MKIVVRAEVLSDRSSHANAMVARKGMISCFQPVVFMLARDSVTELNRSDFIAEQQETGKEHEGTDYGDGRVHDIVRRTFEIRRFGVLQHEELCYWTFVLGFGAAVSFRKIIDLSLLKQVIIEKAFKIGLFF